MLTTPLDEARHLTRLLARHDPFTAMKLRHMAGQFGAAPAAPEAERRCATCQRLLTAGEGRHCRDCRNEDQDFA